MVEQGESGGVEQSVEVDVPVGKIASYQVVYSVSVEEATEGAPLNAIASERVGNVGPVAPSKAASDAAEDVEMVEATPVVDNTDVGKVFGDEDGTGNVSHSKAVFVAVGQVDIGGARLSMCCPVQWRELN